MSKGAIVGAFHVNYVQQKNCFLYLHSKWLKKISKNRNIVSNDRCNLKSKNFKPPCFVQVYDNFATEIIPIICTRFVTTG